MGMDDMFGKTPKASGMNRCIAERSGAFGGELGLQTHGLMAGTRVASNLGWRPIEALTVGDRVLTFDNGMQEITEVRRMTFWTDAPDTPTALWPVIVPAGALDNRAPLTLLPDQGVLVESDTAADMYGDPFAILPAQTLVGVRGIHRAPPAEQVELIAIYFAHEQVIYVEEGALIHCPCIAIALDAFLSTDAGPGYEVLRCADAALIAECLTFEDNIAAPAYARCA